MTTATFDQDSFLAEPCYCGHSRAEHRISVSTGRCRVCPDRHFFQKPALHERLEHEAAVRADPVHVHGPTHTAYACPGFIAFQVCDACGATVR